MHEIEIKFQVDPARKGRVDAAVAGRTPTNRTRLQAAYFDTADRALAKARIALRVRREGRRWVQTLKGAADDGMTRLEHNVDLPPGANATTEADPALHADTEIGQRLARVLAAAGGGGLVCLYRTDVWRRTRRLRTPLGTVELAFDDGRITAGEARLPLCELEIELVDGSPLAVIETGRSWMSKHGLVFDTRSKSERGDMLARGVPIAPPRHAEPVRLDASMPVAEARRAVLRSCLDPILVNASQVASGAFEDEHVHQLRVGLRRLRTALRFFESDLAASLAVKAATLFHGLGAARDDAAMAPIEAAIRKAMEAAGVALPALALVGEDAPAADVVALSRSPSSQGFLLDLLAAAQPVEPPMAGVDSDLRRFMVARLDRWKARLAGSARRFDRLDDPGRHRMRRQAKRLRYGIEFGDALFGRRRVTSYLKSLRKVQDRLGEVTDLALALERVRGRASHEPAAAFASGWLAARQVEAVAACRPALERFVAGLRPWKRKRR